MDFNSYTRYVTETLSKINSDEINKFVDLLFDAFRHEKTVFIIGNGGSAANSSHFAEDLTKATCFSLEQKKRFKALSLTDNLPWISALSNDHGYDIIFEQQLKTFAQNGDILVAISGSGNSLNILKAVDWANNNDVETVGVTGFEGGHLFEMVKTKVHVPLNDMCSSESLHLFIFHYVIIELQKKIELLLKEEN